MRGADVEGAGQGVSGVSSAMDDRSRQSSKDDRENSSFPARFDAHCHLFNLKYLFLEAGEMILDAALGRYPLAPKADLLVPGSVQEVTIEGRLGDFLKWLKSLKEACAGSEEEHLDIVLSAARRHWRDGYRVAAIPLMMDIYYMFAPLMRSGDPPPVQTAPRSDVGIARIGEALREVNRFLHSADLGHELVDFIRDSLLQRHVGRSGNRLPPCTYHDTRGFAHHRDRLADLKFRRPRDLHPFFAVDPRRPGVVDAVVSGRFVGKDKLFQGVKLYPRMGFDPACEALEPLFDWCDRNRIPIVSHCAAQGFPPVGGHDGFGLPYSFLPVLERHPGLVVDFAHFGLYETPWADQVADLIGRYDHVYSDLSCYTRADQIPAFKAAYWDRPKVRERTMFGTDFDVFYLVGIGWTLDAYYDAFRMEKNPGAFGADDLVRMTSTTPRRFLSGVV